MFRHLHTLPNGLPFLIVDTHSFPSLTVMLLVGAGSRYEDEKNNGISHFLEHMAFKGSEQYPTSYDISSVIEGMGGVFNAFTSKDHTAYYVKATRTHYAKIIHILSEMILKPRLLSEEIEKEKGVIKEEINMYEDMPAHKVSEYFDHQMFKGNPLGFDIAGTASTVDSFTRETFQTYLREHYHPNNAVLVVAGGLGGKEGSEDLKVYQPYIDEAQKQFGGWEKRSKIPFVPFDTRMEKSQKVYFKKTEQSHFCLGYKGIPFTDSRRHVASVLGTILGGGMSSRLFMEVREKRGLCYYISTGKEMYQDTGAFVTQAGVSNDPQKINEAIRVIKEQQEEIASGKVTEEEVKRSKDYLVGRLLLSLEDSYKVASFSGGRYLFEKDMTTPREIVEKINAVTSEDVSDLARTIFQDSQMIFSLIGPFEKGDVSLD